MNPIFFYDTETTSLPIWGEPSESDAQPHLVQIAGVLADADNQEALSSIDLIIRPDGWEITEESAAIHGITHEMAMKYGVPESVAVQMFLALRGSAPRVAHNKGFDIRILRIALMRYGTEADVELWAETDDHLCTMAQSKPIVQAPFKNGRGGIKNPTLAEAHLHILGRPLEDAHSALADTVGCMNLYWAMNPVAFPLPAEAS